MKTRWALLSAAIFFGFPSNQMIAAEGVLGQGNVSCDSWIIRVIPGLKVVGMAILL